MSRTLLAGAKEYRVDPDRRSHDVLLPDVLQFRRQSRRGIPPNPDDRRRCGGPVPQWKGGSYRLGVADTTVLNDATPAERTVSDAVLEGPFTVAVSNLVQGVNVLAAEVHQVNATSSDIVWGASVEVLEVRREPATPGYANSVQGTLPPFRTCGSPKSCRGTRTDRRTTPAIGTRGLNYGMPANRPSASRVGGLHRRLVASDQMGFPDRGLLAGAGLSSGLVGQRNIRIHGDRVACGFCRRVSQGNRRAGAKSEVNQTVVDYVTYTAQTPDQSFGTLDMVSPSIHGMLPGPTPGGANQTNRPPRIEPVANQTVAAGNLLAFTVIASDPDVGQALRFALEAPAPSGAVIDATTGRFTWTPPTSEVGTRPVVVVVADDAREPLSDRREFNVIVTPPVVSQVRITGFEWIGDGQTRLTWETVAGRIYRVETAGSLEGTWKSVGDDRFGNRSRMGAGAAGRRRFRFLPGLAVAMMRAAPAWIQKFRFRPPCLSDRAFGLGTSRLCRAIRASDSCRRCASTSSRTGTRRRVGFTCASATRPTSGGTPAMWVTRSTKGFAATVWL